MQDIQEEFDLTYLFISHDLGIVRHMSDRLGIMHNGRLVEEGTRDDIFENAQHPYTKRLLAAIPEMEPEKRMDKKALREEVNRLYREQHDDYYDEHGRVYDLQPLTDTHSVALQGGAKQ